MPIFISCTSVWVFYLPVRSSGRRGVPAAPMLGGVGFPPVAAPQGYPRVPAGFRQRRVQVLRPGRVRHLAGRVYVFHLLDWEVPGGTLPPSRFDQALFLYRGRCPRPLLRLWDDCVAAKMLKRHWVGYDVVEEYCALAESRLEGEACWGTGDRAGHPGCSR